jgi:fatty acid desaturase
MDTNTRARLFRIEAIAIRLTALIVAVMLFGVGFTLLTSPLTVPVTVALWLGAASMVFVGVAIDLHDQQ